MKIVAGLASRDRPLNLQAVITAFYRLRSGEHHVEFLVGLDDDDEDSIVAMQRVVEEIPCASPAH